MRKTLMIIVICLMIPLTQTHSQSLREANEILLKRLQEIHGLSDSQVDSLRSIFLKSGYIGQGNPAITEHPVTETECQDSVAARDTEYQSPLFLEICGHPYMAPLYDPETQRPEDASACIDQFEFPNIPCSYPVVWVRASEAARICEILGKRLCDAHEWEGACAGALYPPDYRFDLAVGKSPEAAIKLMREAHNRKYGTDKIWSYGPEYRTDLCGMSSQKSPKCDGGGWSLCGSNTFPCGFFPDCVSSLGVYDLHGNAAEHMNLPLDSSQMASLGSRVLGYTEMKGSWFIFGRYRAHEDWCRWRAPYWHGSRVMDPKSHHNYHLGFRCCCDTEHDTPQ
ncbi:MAG: SUMF1/EgtB/PvdO family nonheme iron enzyme [Candidatus Eisenbacteria bacterium]